MTEVEFFFDPSCPWTWVTSRWVATVAPYRDLNVRWRTWSLPMKNAGQELPDDLPEDLKARIKAGHTFSGHALRVLEAVSSDQGNDAVGRLYTELGRRAHAAKGDYSLVVIADALVAAGLPDQLAGAGEDERWDKATRDNMADAADQVGDDVGVPIVGLRDNGALRAIAGPIMAEVPPVDRSLRLWDAVMTILGEPGVFELKRRRTGGPTPPAIDSAGRAG